MGDRMIIILNLLIAIGLLWLGAYGTAWAIAKIIIESSDAEILAKVREIKKEAEEAANDY
jgi:hypothetical protein